MTVMCFENYRPIISFFSVGLSLYFLIIKITLHISDRNITISICSRTYHIHFDLPSFSTANFNAVSL